MKLPEHRYLHGFLLDFECNFWYNRIHREDYRK